MSGTTSRDISGEKEHFQPLSQQTRAYGPEYHNAAMSQHRPSEASNDQPERRRLLIQHTTSSPLPSAMKKKDKPKIEKSVTWSPDIIDNEKLPRGQSGSSVPIEFPWQPPSPPTNSTSPRAVHAANTLARANSPAQNQDSVTRFRELGFVLNKSPLNPGTFSQNLPKQDKSPSGYVSQARARANNFSTGVNPSAGATQPSPSVEPQQSKKLGKQRPSANTGKKRDPERLDIVVTIESRFAVRRKRSSSVPPPVPEPPTIQRQVPPPNPRISRLPSPDLPDIGGGTFCTCNPPCTSKYDHEGKPVATKMNEQLEAAKKYIKKHKGNKK